MKNSKGFTAALIVLASIAAAAAAQANNPKADTTDLPGSKDHPMVSRFPGAWIASYEFKEFDELSVPTSASNCAKPSPGNPIRLEGRVTRLKYYQAPNKSTLEVLRNYQQALAVAGFQPVYQGSGDELCQDLKTSRERAESFYNVLGIRIPGGTRDTAVHWPKTNASVRYLLSRLSRPQGDVYVSLYVMESSWDALLPYKPVATELDVVEVKPMQTGQVSINAKAMADAIASTGHVSLYGIYFDTGSAIVKPASDATLKEVSKLLASDPKLSLYVVGHTDSAGNFGQNLKLSQDRAAAVVQALATRYQVSDKRLSPHGVSSLVPVATNDQDEGRSRNRRVELVKQ